MYEREMTVKPPPPLLPARARVRIGRRVVMGWGRGDAHWSVRFTHSFTSYQPYRTFLYCAMFDKADISAEQFCFVIGITSSRVKIEQRVK